MFRRRQRIQYKTPEQIRKMRAAGLVVAEVHQAMREYAGPGVSTAELDRIAEKIIRSSGAVPSFKGYDIGFGPYPASICASVNEQVVHAIPSADAVLEEGDLLSVDVGAIVDGWHGDAAISIEIGEVDPRVRALREACEAAMWAGIGAAATAKRLGGISHAIEQAADRAGDYGIVTGFGGHGIGTEMHQDPHILNYGRPGEGPKLRAGMALAIEPMLTLGSEDTAELGDGWTVVTEDGSVAAHTEHTIALCEDGVWVLTAPDGGVEQLGEAAASAARAE
ncbi:type I methionyl aminopeptidase [Glycomyces harbinensis]|uniref:Methionine aminopeptidase n=1 Tax=Glycomyces harbinensis TaxID=58114 RepID=A0A1G7D426_9ACTN|nr:type I methionyl aminopeptidase [Glycomyces harbinensis]SDE45485.1 methionyl aminopeptidase [Glycomyces harbinensis]